MDEARNNDDSTQVNDVHAKDGTEAQSNGDVEKGKETPTIDTEEALYTIFTRKERYFLVFMIALAGMFRYAIS
jgi:hypothetical protein